MTSIHENKKITLELTREQLEFLEWAAKLEGLTPEKYLLKIASGRVIKATNPKIRIDARKCQFSPSSPLASAAPPLEHRPCCI